MIHEVLTHLILVLFFKIEVIGTIPHTSVFKAFSLIPRKESTLIRKSPGPPDPLLSLGNVVFCNLKVVIMPLENVLERLPSYIEIAYTEKTCVWLKQLPLSFFAELQNLTKPIHNVLLTCVGSCELVLKLWFASFIHQDEFLIIGAVTCVSLVLLQ